MPSRQDTAAFDVIVAGGGAAGCVMAARLAESPARRVLLIEAGPDRRADLPEAFRDGWSFPREFDWGYSSEPDGRGQSGLVRRTKLLGGSSWLTRFGLRGAAADYGRWSQLGNPGWSFEEVLPHFIRLENDVEFGDRPWHGDGGPIPLTRYPHVELCDVTAAGLEALGESGFAAVEDHNEPGAVGAGRMPMSARDGVRVTTADGYLPLHGAPPNLTVRCDAILDAVLFDGSAARGVRLADGGEIEAGWVVVCAGVYGSPAILLRSGIGPASHLREVAVPVRVDLPGVGANLADHPTVDVDCGECHGRPRSAPLLHVVATFHSTDGPTPERPDMLLWISDPDGEPATFEIAVVLLTPQSRGHVRLRSRDPLEQPAITLPDLDHPSDVARLAEGYRRAHELARSGRLQPFVSGPATPMPDDSGAHAFVRAEHYSVPHTVGTCAMGPRPDEGAVVDAAGSVHGTERLTVADASIMPDATSGFSHLPTIMIAERLSALLGTRL